LGLIKKVDNERPAAKPRADRRQLLERLEAGSCP
jgi:hypothetical protein